MSKKAEDDWTTYDIQTGRVVSKNRNNALSKALLKEAEKDLALNLEQVVKIDNIIMNMVGEGYNNGYKTRPFYEEALRRFNK